MSMKKEFIAGKAFMIPNVVVEWAYLVNPDVAFGDKQWKITMRLPEKLAEGMIDAGFSVGKDKKEGYYKITAKRKTVTLKGVTFEPPKVVDAAKNEINGSKVGNGSVCNVLVYAKYYEVGGKTTLPLRLNSVQVIDLVEFSGAGMDFDDVSGGEKADEGTDILFG